MRDRTINFLQSVVIVGIFLLIAIVGLKTPASSQPEVLVPTAIPAAYPVPNPLNFETGIASWYGPGYEGKTTASGTTFHMNDMTLACHHLPFGTIVRVTNPKTGKSCIGMVTDRGPNVAARKYDLSCAMAEKIGMIRDGLANVTVELLLAMKEKT